MERRQDGLFIGQEPFRITGANNYYLGNVEEATVGGVLDLAESIGCNTLRIWAFAGRDEAALTRLDRAVDLARQRGLRLILTLENYWKDFGGVPAYVKQFGLRKTAEFYRDLGCRAAYREWVEQVITRKNVFTGRQYSNEPAILAWELMNEPRCAHVVRRQEILLEWISEMTQAVRLMAPKQLIAVGDEGFFHWLDAKSWLYDGSQGVNCEAILELETVDFGTYHLYIDQGWASGNDAVAFGRRWIREHIEAGRRTNKPALLEEFGVAMEPEARAELYGEWLSEVNEQHGLGALVWMIGLPEGPGQPYALDPYAITDGPELAVLRKYAETDQSL
ncbi:MAG TPA: cellulase family glycosylhydrolase [Bryobacteraceae bacterium]|nr:cellulase family glycosylhydrolase [Bryobacteraceae bacterium]